MRRFLSPPLAGEAAFLAGVVGPRTGRISQQLRGPRAGPFSIPGHRFTEEEPQPFFPQTQALQRKKRSEACLQTLNLTRFDLLGGRGERSVRCPALLGERFFCSRNSRKARPRLLGTLNRPWICDEIVLPNTALASYPKECRSIFKLFHLVSFSGAQVHFCWEPSLGWLPPPVSILPWLKPNAEPENEMI